MLRLTLLTAVLLAVMSCAHPALAQHEIPRASEMVAWTKLSIHPSRENGGIFPISAHCRTVIDRQGFINDPSNPKVYADVSADGILFSEGMKFPEEMTGKGKIFFDPGGAIRSESLQKKLYPAAKKFFEKAELLGVINARLELRFDHILTTDPEMLARIAQAPPLVVNVPPTPWTQERPILLWGGRELNEEDGRRRLARLGVSNDIIDRFYQRTLELDELTTLRTLVREEDPLNDVQIELTGSGEGTFTVDTLALEGEFGGTVEIKATMPLSSANQARHEVQNFIGETYREFAPIVQDAVQELFNDIAGFLEPYTNAVHRWIRARYGDNPPWLIRQIFGDPQSSGD